MKVKETYLEGCKHCGATGIVPQYTYSTLGSVTNICPVCNGSKVVIVAREYEVPDLNIPSIPFCQTDWSTFKPAERGTKSGGTITTHDLKEIDEAREHGYNVIELTNLVEK